MISNDQRSPNISRDTLTGHPERGFDLDLDPTAEHDTNSACKRQVTGEILEGRNQWARMLSN
jgi:hypothetical protein